MPDQLKLFLVDPAPPPEAASPTPDQRNHALDVHHSWIVEAPAGSGKTGLLIQRYLKLLALPSVEAPEQVFAITFTRRATAEMRERVLAQLRAAAAGQPALEDLSAFDRATRPLALAVLERDRTRATPWALLDNPHRLAIRSIDSVCSTIANSLPVLSGSGGRRVPVDDAAPLYALAASRTFLQLGGSDSSLGRALETVLLHRDGSLSECQRLLAAMLERREQWGGLVPIGPARLDDAWLDANVLPKLKRSLDYAICSTLTHVAKTVPADFLAQLTTAAAEMAHLEGYRGNISPIAVCAGRFDPPGATAEHLAHWRALAQLLVTKGGTWRKSFSNSNVGFDSSKFEQNLLKSLVAQIEHREDLLAVVCSIAVLPPAHYPPEQWRVARALFRVLNRALAELQLVFAERGECDYTEVLLTARSVLDADANDSGHETGDGHESLLGFRLQHLLVDEMQDTSAGQVELIESLTRGWDGQSQTVFLVGDPKQSIYLFRQARVERFLHTMRTGYLGDLALGRLRLTANFRSRAGLVQHFNDDFARIFPAESPDLPAGAIPYVAATSARTESHNSGLAPPDGVYAPYLATAHDGRDRAAINGRVWHATVLARETADAAPARTQRRFDANEICRIVQSWRDRPPPPPRGASETPNHWKIAVLCRARSHLNEIVAAFKRAAIPFRSVDIDPLKDRPEVRDLVALTRALLHPADRVAWLATLRAPWCGLSLADLATLTGEGDQADSTPPERPFSKSSIPRLIAERCHRLSDTACQRLERLWPILEAATAARARLPLAQLVERTWHSIGGSSYLGPIETANANRYLQLLDETHEEAAQAFDLSLLERRLEKLFAEPGAEAGAVELLTIHNAKGLEWDVVFVPALERPAPANRPYLLNWLELDPSSNSAEEDEAHFLLAPIQGKGLPSHDLNRYIASVHNARAAAERKRLFYVACTRARRELHLFAALKPSSNGGFTPESLSLLAGVWPAAQQVFATALVAAAQRAYLDQAQPEPTVLTRLAAGGPVESEAGFLADSEAGLLDDSDEGNADPATLADGTALSPVLAFPPAEDRTTRLQRLPLAFDPAQQICAAPPLSYGALPAAPAAPRFERPEGSLEARAFGTAVHAFLDLLTTRIAAGEAPARLRAALASWTTRVAAVLRSEGLPPAEIARLSTRVLLALENTLKDPTGFWLLSPHPGAASEYALTAGLPSVSGNGSVRIDRIFRAGSQPLEEVSESGQQHLWIVDYKTTAPGAAFRNLLDSEAFLAAERAKYAPQLEAYAAVLSGADPAQGPPTSIRLALYYPQIPKLLWWQREAVVPS